LTDYWSPPTQFVRADESGVRRALVHQLAEAKNAAANIIMICVTALDRGNALIRVDAELSLLEQRAQIERIPVAGAMR
jgi:hypothetical protein